MRRLLFALCLFLPLLGCDYEPIFAQEYPAKVDDIHDSDTITATIDLGFDVFIRRKIRIKDFDAWEVGNRNGQIVTEEEKAKGREARDHLRKLIVEARIITVTRPAKLVYSFDRIVLDVSIDGVLIKTLMKPFERVPTPKRKQGLVE